MVFLKQLLALTAYCCGLLPAALLAAGVEVSVVTIEGEEKKATLADSDSGLKIDAAGVALKDVASIVLGPRDKQPDGTVLYLRNGDILGSITIVSGDDSKLTFKTENCGEMTLDNKLLHALTFPGKERPAAEALEAFLKGPKTKEDMLLLPKGDTVSGYIEKFSDKDLTFNAGGQSRPYTFEQVAAFRLAPLEEFKARTDPLASVELKDGSRITGKIVSLKEKTLSIEGINLQPWRIPVDAIAAIEFKGGKMVYLSQLAPTAVEQQPYAGGAPVVYRWRKDKAASGGKLLVGGKEFSRGLGVHSYCKLTYALDGQYAKFLCTAGMDQTAGSDAVCSWKVLVDGKEAAVDNAKGGGNASIPAGGESRSKSEIRVDVSGAAKLELVCDFGPDSDDAGDHFDWADARLIKP
ncbi:MAG TPA: NPCBM/NEW2 domain-containing protein [Planctomycetota bacterium]|jgi:hypothetical protein